MSDDPRIEAAAHVLAHLCYGAHPGNDGWDKLTPAIRANCLNDAGMIIAAADRAAWRPGPPPRDRRVYLAANDSWVYTTVWHQSRGWVDGGPTYAAIPYSEEPLCHQPLPAPPEDSQEQED